MLQLTTFLIHQNGSIHEGLNLWKKNVDKRFEGVEVSFSHIRARNYLFKPIKCYSQLLSDCLDLYRYQCEGNIFIVRIKRDGLMIFNKSTKVPT